MTVHDGGTLTFIGGEFVATPDPGLAALLGSVTIRVHVQPPWRFGQTTAIIDYTLTVPKWRRILIAPLHQLVGSTWVTSTGRVVHIPPGDPLGQRLVREVDAAIEEIARELGR